MGINTRCTKKVTYTIQFFMEDVVACREIATSFLQEKRGIMQKLGTVKCKFLIKVMVVTLFCCNLTAVSSSLKRTRVSETSLIAIIQLRNLYLLDQIFFRFTHQPDQLFFYDLRRVSNKIIKGLRNVLLNN